jgi:hypothetical protein
MRFAISLRRCVVLSAHNNRVRNFLSVAHQLFKRQFRVEGLGGGCLMVVPFEDRPVPVEEDEIAVAGAVDGRKVRLG